MRPLKSVCWSQSCHRPLVGVLPVALLLSLVSTAPAQETQKNPERNAYFGETHLHTSFSTDAFIWQNRTTPDDAYRYGKGEAIDHPSGYKRVLRKPKCERLSSLGILRIRVMRG